jgi:hypothetical protein
VLIPCKIKHANGKAIHFTTIVENEPMNALLSSVNRTGKKAEREER